MKTYQGKVNGVQRSGNSGKWIIPVLVIVICSAISWGMVYYLSAPKAEYTSEITKINNSLGHLGSIVTGLDNFASYQTSRLDDLADVTQKQYEDMVSRITEADTRLSNQITTVNTQLGSRIDTVNTQLNSKIDTSYNNLTEKLTAVSTELGGEIKSINSELDDVGGRLGTLETKVAASAGGLQITPTVTTTSTGGTISLSIKSDVAQTVAFRIDMRPTTDVALSATMDASLATLYGTPPVTLTAGSAVRGDYTLFWSTSDSKYHLGMITFVTKKTSLTAGTQTKQITYTASANYEILITPVFPTGSSTGSW